MRIAFFADNFYPELSGIADSIRITGKELTRRGHEVVYVGPRYAPKDYAVVDRTRHEKNGHEEFDNMSIVRLPSMPLPFSPTGQSRLAFPTGASFSFLDSFKPDIIHTHSPYGIGFEALRAAKRYRAPLVGTNHTPVEEYYPFAPTAMRHFDAWYYNHCSFVSAPFGDLIANMRKAGFKRPAEVVANPLRLSLFSPASSAEKATLKETLGLHGPVLLFCGGLTSGKHVDVILKAVTKLLPAFPPLTVIVIGHGSEAARLRALAKELQIEKNILFTGYKKMEELGPYYKTADLFTIMSTVDAQSIALMQAYASGIPAIAARSRGLVDYTPADCGFLVEPGNIGELAAKITELLNDTPLRERMGAAGVEFAKKFSPDLIADRWEHIYKNALK